MIQPTEMNLKNMWNDIRFTENNLCRMIFHLQDFLEDIKMNAEWRKIRTVSQKGESVRGNGVEIVKGHEGTFWDDANVFCLARGLGYILNIFMFCHI